MQKNNSSTHYCNINLIHKRIILRNQNFTELNLNDLQSKIHQLASEILNDSVFSE